MCTGRLKFMFKESLISSFKTTLRLALAVIGLLALMLLLQYLNGGTEAVSEYVGSINVRQLIGPVLAFFLVAALLPTVVMCLVSKNKK